MKKSYIIITVTFILVYILPLGVRPMFLPDEYRYAEAPREMLTTGDWVVPRLCGLRHFEKPVLGYWLNALSFMIFGKNSFALRFPSALAAGICALIIFILVRKFTLNYETGILASAVFLTCILVFTVGTFAVLDSVLSMLLTGAMTSYFFAHMEDKRGKKALYLALFGLFCGFAFLTKGLIAFVMPVGIIVPFMIWQRRFKELFKICWIPLITALIVLLPWSIMIHIREGDFWNHFLWKGHIERFLEEDAVHSSPFWFFLPVLLAGSLPWTVVFPAVFLGLKENGLKESLVRFAICWFLFPFLFFSVSSGKLGTYILPCFAPLAVLIALGLTKYFSLGKDRAFVIGASYAGKVLVVASVIFVGVIIANFEGLKIYGDGETWKWFLGFAGVLSWAFFSWSGSRQGDYRKKLAIYSAAPLLGMLFTPFIMPDKIELDRAPGKFIERHCNRIKPDMVIVVSDGNIAPAVSWHCKRTELYILSGRGLSYGLDCDDSKYRRLTMKSLKRWFKKTYKTKSVVIFTTLKDYPLCKMQLPEPFFEDKDNEYAFIEFHSKSNSNR